MTKIADISRFETAPRQVGGPLIALIAMGLAILAFVAVGPWIVRTYGHNVFVPGMVATGLITLAATSLAPAVPARAGLIIILGFAVVMRLLAVAEEPLLSTDLYRYVWDGKVQAAGINPYLYVPADPALAKLRDAAIYPHINRVETAVTAYPPFAEMFFLAVTRVSETITGMRLAMVASEIVTIAVIIDLLRRLGLPLAAAVAWAWHPLAIWEIANNGHVDALMVALVMAGIWLLARNRAVWGAVAVALAAAVKPYALLVLPCFWRPLNWRLPLAVVATIALCYLPYLGAGSGVVGYVGKGYFSEEGFASGEAFWLVALAQRLIGDVPGLTTAYILIAATVLAWLALRVLLRTGTTLQVTLTDIATLLMAGLFFLSPNYPWYFHAAVPFLVLGGGAPAWAMTLAGILLYRPSLLPDNDLIWKTFTGLPFVIAVVATLLSRRRPSTHIQDASQWSS